MSAPRLHRRGALGVLACAALGAGASACGDDEGTVRRVSFGVMAAGFARASAGPLELTTPRGWRVALERAELALGPVYFRNSAPTMGTSPDSAEEGRAVAQVLAQFTVNALDPELREVPGGGNGVSERARAAEVRFTTEIRRDVVVIARVAGTATREGADPVRFDGALAATDEIAGSGFAQTAFTRVTGIAADFTPAEGGALVIRVDPSRWFEMVEFADLGPSGAPVRTFADRTGALALHNGLARAAGVFEFAWQPPPG